MRYNDLIKQNLISPSIAELLVEEHQRRMSFRSFAFPALAFKISALYTALIQAYILARSIKDGVLVGNANYPSVMFSSIKSTWDVTDEKPKTFRHDYKHWVFSFLHQCEKAGRSELFGTDAVRMINKAREALPDQTNDDESADNVRLFRSPLSEEDFIGYLEALPLLRYTAIDREQMCFVFRIPNSNGQTSVYEIDYRPFLYFWDDQNNISSESLCSNCYIITHVSKGKEIGELAVRIMPLSSIATNIETKQITWQASQNETVRMIFSSLEIPTDWLVIEECWCDLAFMQRLAKVAEIVLPNYWGIRLSDRKGCNIKDRLIKHFEEDPSMSTSLSERWDSNSKILISNIENVLFGLFINHGIFRTMRAFFWDSATQEASKKDLFMLSLEAFQKLNYISNDQKSRYQKECTREIEDHLAALRTKVPYENSPQFQSRSREIRAEWQAYTILRAAGIRADNLLVDKEAIYSIDDYFNMIQNTKTSTEENLCEVLRLLIKVYAPLVKKTPNKRKADNGFKLDENQYYRMAARIDHEIASFSLNELFERLIAIVKESENHAVIRGLLGRDRICNAEDLEDFHRDIMDLLMPADSEENHSEALDISGACDFSKRFIFVSYSHADKELVNHYVNTWRNEYNYNIFIDQTEFHTGEDWIEKAVKAIQHKNCAVVAVFISKNSGGSFAVRQELTCANDERPEKYPIGSALSNRFIYPINLDEEYNIGQLLTRVATYGKTSQVKGNASEIIKFMPDVSIYSNLKSLEDGTQKEELREMLEFRPQKEKKRDANYTELERQIAKFYTFLKYGDGCDWSDDDIDGYFKNNSISLSHCIYPIAASMKETKIHRDNITMVGYEMVNGKGEHGNRTNYILTSKPLMNPDDYYCIPHLKRVGDDCSWMIDPLLISHKQMTEAPSSEKEEKNG